MNNYVAWIDIETTGVNLKKSEILQIALIITDNDLVEISRFDWVVKYPNVNKIIKKCNNYVLEMHNDTGLWDRMRSDEAVPLKLIDEELFNVLTMYFPDGNVRLGGNSVHFDLYFLKEKLVKTPELLSHQVLNVSSLLSFMMMFDAKPNLDGINKMTHNAIEDIEKSIEYTRRVKNKINELRGD